MPTLLSLENDCWVFRAQFKSQMSLTNSARSSHRPEAECALLFSVLPIPALATPCQSKLPEVMAFPSTQHPHPTSVSWQQWPSYLIRIRHRQLPSAPCCREHLDSYHSLTTPTVHTWVLPLKCPPSLLGASKVALSNSFVSKCTACVPALNCLFLKGSVPSADLQLSWNLAFKEKDHRISPCPRTVL